MCVVRACVLACVCRTQNRKSNRWTAAPGRDGRAARQTSRKNSRSCAQETPLNLLLHQYTSCFSSCLLVLLFLRESTTTRAPKWRGLKTATKWREQITLMFGFWKFINRRKTLRILVAGVNSSCPTHLPFPCWIFLCWNALFFTFFVQSFNSNSAFPPLKRHK